MIDLRTIVPPDLETVMASVAKTRRLLVVHEDRVFASLGRELQGSVIEAMAGQPLATRVLGQDAVPGIPQNARLEEQLVVSPEKIIKAAHEVMALPLGAGGGASAPAPAAAPTVLWTPNRNFVA